MQPGDSQNNPVDKWLYFLIGIAVLTNFSGLFVPLIDPDAGVYASITRNMVVNNDYINLYFQDKDWLDKPHFPFWITAIFFKLFGLHDWSYKLPGILFVMLGARYTYLFAKQYYNKTIALLSVLVLLCSAHIIVSNNDVRAEPYLTGLLIAAVYHFSNSLSKNISWHLVAACFFSACAVMTKGPYTLILVAGAIAGELIIKQNWKQLFHWKWIVALLMTMIFIAPELYSLWVQFDAHPEKIIFNKTGVSGIRFFFWDSQFGRFFNSGPIKGEGSPFFFLHTLIWAFLPWSFIMYAALFVKIRSGFKKNKKTFKEWFTVSGSLTALLIFSVSSFQLPYYTNIIFPFLSILTAHFIWQEVQAKRKIFNIIQSIVAVGLIVLLIILFVYYSPPMNYFVIAVLFLLLLILIRPQVFNTDKPYIPFTRSAVAIIIVTASLNLVFYPDLLKYESGNVAAFYINKNHPGEAVGRVNIYMPAGEFYLDQHMTVTTIEEISRGNFSRPGLLFLTEGELKQLEINNVEYELKKQFSHFHVSMLSLKFLSTKSRKEELEKRFLVKLH